MIKILIACDICCLIYSLLFSGFYFSNKRKKNLETKIFNAMIIVTITSFISELVLNSCASLIYKNNLLSRGLIDIYMAHYITASVLLMTYLIFKHLIRINSDKLDNKKKTIGICIICYYIFCLCLTVLTSNVPKYDGVHLYGEGLSIIIAAITMGITALFSIYYFIKDYKLLSRREKILMISIISLYSIGGLVRLINSQVLINNVLYSFITYIMFFTIEDPYVEEIEELDKDSHDKEDYINALSNELVKPISKIVELSDKESDNVNDLEYNIGSIHDECLVLKEIIDNIDEINNFDSDHIKNNNVSYNLRETINSVGLKYKGELLDKHIDFNIVFDGSVPESVTGNSNAIKSILDKIYSNSVKYTKRGYINTDVKCDVIDGMYKVVIKVRDTGVGFKEDGINKAFDDFVKGVDNDSESYSGVGIGLSIVKRIVNALDGEISIISDKECGTEINLFIMQDK